MVEKRKPREVANTAARLRPASALAASFPHPVHFIEKEASLAEKGEEWEPRVSEALRPPQTSQAQSRWPLLSAEVRESQEGTPGPVPTESELAEGRVRSWPGPAASGPRLSGWLQMTVFLRRLPGALPLEVFPASLTIST